jgi:hypothetical protein
VQVVPKAFVISKNITAVDILLLKFRVTWSASLVYWRAVLWCAWKPKWLLCSSFFSSAYLWTVFRIAFSNNLPIVDKRHIEHKIWGNFGSLSCLDEVNMFASFQDCRKWDSQKHWLNKCMIWDSDLHGRCLRHSFRILSKLHALFNFGMFIRFWMSQGLTYLGNCYLWSWAELEL